MGLKDRFKKKFKRETPTNRSSNQNNTVKLGDAQENETAQRPKVRIEDTPISELWNVAYENLREEDGALIAEYEKSFQRNIAAGLRESLHLKPNMRDQLRTVLEERMNEVSKKASKLGKTEVPATEAVQLILKIVDSANDYISSAASANPYTSIAWSGVSLMLPLLMNPSKQRDSLAKALGDIASLITQSIMREEFYKECYKPGSSSHETFRLSHGQYMVALESLYRQILKFQVISCCYYSKNSAFRLGLDAVKWNDWRQLLAEVHEKNNSFIAVENIMRDIRLHEERKAADDRQQAALHSFSAMNMELSKANKIKEAEGYTKLLRWLCDIDPSSMYNAARDKHEAGTCGWLVQDSDEFKAWEEGKSSLLWLHGKAGSGKSILSSSVINHLQDRHASKPSTALAYFYFSFSDPKKQNVDGMLASLVKQINSCQPNKQILQRLGDYMAKEQRPDIKTLQEVLMTSLDGFSDVYVVIDALDECPMLNGRREKLLKSLRYILANAPDSLHVFLTSRKEPDIDVKIRAHLSEPLKIEIDLLAHREILNRDILHYIDSKLASEDFQSWPESIKMQARNSLIDKADCMFQYVQCQFEILQNLSSESLIHRALENLPAGLDATYDRIFTNINSDFKDQVINSLKWLAFSMKTLTLGQLSEIFILRLHGDVVIDEAERLFSPEDILKYFSGLIVTQKGRNSVIEVRLVHFSLKEYFISTRIVESAPAFAFTEIEAHISIGRSCLAYLAQFSTKIARQFQHQVSGLAKYMLDYWMIHLEEIPCARWPPKMAQDAALVLGAHSQSFLNQLLNQLGINREFHNVNISDFLRLQSYGYTAWLGLCRSTQMLVSQELNAYSTQEDLDVALQYAASEGNIEAMKTLLEAGADANAEGEKWGSALLAAASKGKLSALELLVKFGANVNDPSERGRCLLTSIKEEPIQCLKFLLDSGADIDMQGSSDGTALYKAIGSNRFSLCKLLLERNANVNAVGGEYYTPLQRTCIRGGVPQILHWVETLLERGADPNIRGGELGTALQAVCRHGAAGMISVVQLLIEHGADVNIRGGLYGSAFNAAASSMSSEAVQIMKLLVDNGAEIDQQGDGELGAALHIACNEGSTETVRWLLDNGADVNEESGRFATPLQAAVAGEPWDREQEVLDIVELLMERGARVNQQGGEYGTALQAAFWKWDADERLRGLLLEHGADVNIKGGKYGSVLAAACGNRQLGVESVRLLLDRGADVNADGGEYGSALIAACVRPRGEDAVEMVQLLLDHGANVNTEGGIYGTALAAACTHGASHGVSLGVVSLLLERGADPRRRDCLAWHMAALLDSSDAVPILDLFLDHIDINHVHEEYGTALHAAIECWSLSYDHLMPLRYETARLLLERGADADIMAGEFGFPLQAACAAEYRPKPYGQYFTDIDYPCVKTQLLLEQRPNINVNAQGGIFGTALQAAAYSGQTASVRLLLDNKADCNLRGGKYGSAFNAAIIRGNWHIVEILLKAGATPDCRLQAEPDKEWLQRVREEDGRGAYERYMKFWEVQSASDCIST